MENEQRSGIDASSCYHIFYWFPYQFFDRICNIINHIQVTLLESKLWCLHSLSWKLIQKDSNNYRNNKFRVDVFFSIWNSLKPQDWTGKLDVWENISFEAVIYYSKKRKDLSISALVVDNVQHMIVIVYTWDPQMATRAPYVAHWKVQSGASGKLVKTKMKHQIGYWSIQTFQ